MSHRNKRPHSSKEEGEWKKISLEGEWEKISLKGEGEWRKISLPNKEQDDEEKKKSLRHDTMIPLQDILKSKLPAPVLKSKVPKPVLKAPLPPPVLLSNLPPPVEMSNFSTPVSMSNFLPPPVSLSNFLPAPASMSKISPKVRVSKFSPPVSVSKFSPPASVSKFAPKVRVSRFSPAVPVSKFSPPVSKPDFMPPPVSNSNLPPPVSKSKVPTPNLKPNVSEIHGFLENEKLQNQKAILELSACPVFYSNITSCVQKRVFKPVEFFDCILFLPNPNDMPVVRQNYPESNNIYISGIPTFVSEDTVKKIFELCGEIRGIKFNGEGCCIQFDSKESGSKAVKLTGSKIIAKTYAGDLLPRGFLTRLFVYFDKPVEEVSAKSSLTSLQERDTADYNYNFTNKRARRMTRVLKDENRYLTVIPDLMVWLKKGECKKDTNNNFLNIIKSLFEVQVRRLNKEAEVVKMNYYDKAEMPVQQVMEKISVQLDDICRMFNCAKAKNVWCSFSKWQKKNLDLCRLITLEIRNVHYQELIHNRREEEMDMSDQECDSDEMSSSKKLCIEDSKKDSDFNFQTNNLEASTSSQGKLYEKDNKVFNTSDFEDKSTVPNEMATSQEECYLYGIDSSENSCVETDERGLSINFQSTDIETSGKSSQECFEERDASYQDNILEATVTSTVPSKIITDREECDSDGNNLSKNSYVKEDKEDLSSKFQTNNLETPVNSSELPFLESTIPFLNTSCQDDIVESTVSSTDQSKMVTNHEECDSNGISSSKNYFKSNKGDVFSDIQTHDFQIPLIGSSEMITDPINPKDDSVSCSQNCDNMNVSQNDLRLMILITSFLMVCPSGANLESVCQHLNNARPIVETQTVVNVLKKFPNLFQEDCSKSNESSITNWKFVGLNI